MQRIGRYEILDELGRGAMGVVYRARDPSIGRLIAIKTIRMTELSDPVESERLKERLRREAHSAGILSHPNIVVVYDVGQEGELAYIAMELVPGRSLESLLSDATPPGRQTLLNVLRQTAAALDYAHKKGIVHRDVKPANILISEDGVVKITDFGVAKISSSQQLTVAGTVLGTPNYMSPEQVQGKPVDGRADQFALAVIAYEVLTGEKPFTGDHLTAVLYKIVAEAPRPPQEVNPALPWPVSLVLNKALAKNPEERYATCTEFIEALENALETKKDWEPGARSGGEALPTATVGTTVKERVAARVQQEAVRKAEGPPARKRGWAPVLVGLAALLAVGVGAFLGYQRWGSQPAAGPSPPAPTASQKPTPMPTPATPAPPASEPTGPAGASVPSPAQPGPAEPAAPAVTTKPAAAPTVPAASKATERPPESGVVRGPSQALDRKKGGPYQVMVTSSPPGAEVVFDGSAENKCKTPCSIALTAGRHTLVATLEGHRTEMRILELTGPREVFLSMMRQTGTVRVESTPPGAQILLNGQPRPETTPATLILPVGRYEIQVIKNGQKDQQSIELKEGALLRVSFQLSP